MGRNWAAKCKTIPCVHSLNHTNALSEWSDIFDEEPSIAQATGLEYIVMGDFNIDLHTCTNTKWLNMIQLFDLYQLITE